MIKWIPTLFLLILIAGCGSETVSDPLSLLNGEQSSQSTNPSPTIESIIESTPIVETSIPNPTTTNSLPDVDGNAPVETPDQPTITKSTSPQIDTSTTRGETPEPTSSNQNGPTEPARLVCKLPSILDYETGQCYRNPGSRNEEEQEELNRAEKRAAEDFPDDGGQRDDVPTNSGEQAG